MYQYGIDLYDIAYYVHEFHCYSTERLLLTINNCLCVVDLYIRLFKVTWNQDLTVPFVTHMRL